jgi:hypothetical protein
LRLIRLRLPWWLHRLLLLLLHLLPLYRLYSCVGCCCCYGVSSAASGFVVRLLAAAMALAPLHLFVVASFAAFGCLHRLCCLHHLLLAVGGFRRICFCCCIVLTATIAFDSAASAFVLASFAAGWLRLPLWLHQLCCCAFLRLHRLLSHPPLLLLLRLIRI